MLECGVKVVGLCCVAGVGIIVLIMFGGTITEALADLFDSMEDSLGLGWTLLIGLGAVALTVLVCIAALNDL